MSIILNGTSGITTPGLTNTGSQTVINLTTSGNTILGDASTDTLNVAAGTLVTNGAGNVGIGTSSPTQRLDVNGVVKLALTSAPTWDTNSYLWSESGVGLNLDGFNVKINTGNTRNERMRIDSSGNVGIGTSSPAYKLDISPNSGQTIVRINGGASNTADGGAIYIRNGADTNIAYGNISAITGGAYNGVNAVWGALGTAFFTAGANERMRIDSSGNVGIGVSSPQYRLDVRASGDTIASITAIGGTNGAALLRLFGSDNSTFSAFNAIASQNSNGTQQWYMGGDGNANTIVFKTITSERMRIDSAGNVGIGTSSPTGRLTVSGTLHLVGSGTFPATGEGLEIVPAAAGGDNYVQAYSRTASSWQKLNITALQTVFGTNGSERMRIDGSGTVLIGKSTTDIATVGSYITSTAGIYTTFTISSGTNEMSIYNNTSTGGNARFDFRVANVSKGYIQWNNTNTTFSTTSDYRLKENVAPMIGALDTVAKLKPVTYKWKTDGSDGQGFIAHELQEVVPECVTGEKDAVDEEGKPIYQGIDTSFLVATLTAAIQELKAELNVVKSELNTLKGN
jgi:hypothetical protein